MVEYRFVCVDTQGRWQDVRYASFASDADAKAFACDLWREFAAILVYERDRQVAMLALVA